MVIFDPEVVLVSLNINLLNHLLVTGLNLYHFYDPVEGQRITVHRDLNSFIFVDLLHYTCKVWYIIVLAHPITV